MMVLILFFIASISICFALKHSLVVKNERASFNKIDASKLKADDLDCKQLVIWDCDGVLVDSEALLKQGEVEALESLGFSLSVDDCVRLFSGVSPDTAAVEFFLHSNLNQFCIFSPKY